MHPHLERQCWPNTIQHFPNPPKKTLSSQLLDTTTSAHNGWHKAHDQNWPSSISSYIIMSTRYWEAERARYTHACNRLIIWCSRSYIIGIRKLVDAMLQQWDSTLKAWQNIVSKVEPFLNPAKSWGPLNTAQILVPETSTSLTVITTCFLATASCC